VGSLCEGSPAEKLGLNLSRIAGGPGSCRTDTREWRAFWDAYQTLKYGNPEKESVDAFRSQLYTLVLTNHTRALECNVGVVAGYTLVGDFAMMRSEVDFAYRSYQMAMIFVYTLRQPKQIIPLSNEIEWNVSRAHIIKMIQQLKFNRPDPIPSHSLLVAPKLRIAIVTICAYVDDHPLILKDITPVNRERYATQHGYELFLYRNHPLNDTVCIQHSKLEVVRSIIQSDRFDWVMWMDCDSIIVNEHRRIEDIITEYASSNHDLLITEELLGLSSANWIIRSSDWSERFLSDAFRIANQELPLFGDQDSLISLAIGQGFLEDKVAIIPQHTINAYDALNAFAMGSGGYEAGDLLVTFPQCKDVSCNVLFYEAFKASEDCGAGISKTPPENRTLPQLRVFGPPQVIGNLYFNK
jgi:hypothetical protein